MLAANIAVWIGLPLFAGWLVSLGFRRLARSRRKWVIALGWSGAALLLAGGLYLTLKYLGTFAAELAEAVGPHLMDRLGFSVMLYFHAFYLLGAIHGLWLGTKQRRLRAG